MANKFHGSIDELKDSVKTANILGKWQDDGTGKHSFRARNGGIMNFWESNGTLQFQGAQKAKAELEQAISLALSCDSESGQYLRQSTSSASVKRHIFIVHGHDSNARDQLELALRRLELEPFILMNTSGGGKTIIEALEGQIGKDFISDFGIVLMTPDDMGYAQKDGEEKIEPRARQNVILETGMLLASLTREHMALVVKGHIELPSDLQGIIRMGYNDHIREVIPKLCQRLKEVGFDIDATTISAATA